MFLVIHQTRVVFHQIFPFCFSFVGKGGGTAPLEGGAIAMVAAMVSGVCGDQQKKPENTQNRAVLHHSVYPAL